MDTKIFFTDLDGTLLNDEKRITKKTFLTLKAWCEAGHKLVLCSGRALDSILHVFETLDLTFPGVYLVGCNGGEIYDCSKKELLLRRTISYSDVEKVFSLAEQYHIHIQTYSETHIITKKGGAELNYYKKAIHTPAIIAENIFSHLPKEPCKCLAIELTDLDRLEQFRQEIKSQLGSRLSVIYSNPNYIEVFPVESGKGSSIIWLCKHLNIPVENSLAAGDEMNDISMIQTAGLGIAMCNGRKEVQELADIVTSSDNNEDGLVKILEQKMQSTI